MKASLFGLICMLTGRALKGTHGAYLHFSAGGVGSRKSDKFCLNETRTSKSKTHRDPKKESRVTACAQLGCAPCRTKCIMVKMSTCESTDQVLAPCVVAVVQ